MEELVEIQFPEYANVKIGNSIFELSFDSLIASMVHQYLNNFHKQDSAGDYNVIFDVTKGLITDFVMDDLIKREHIDILGDWVHEFITYHNDKNKPLCKDIHIQFENGSIWQIKLLDLLAHKYNIDESVEEFDIDYDDPCVKDDNEIVKYLETLNWETLADMAEEIQKPQPEPDYSSMYESAKKEVVSWEKPVSLLDFFDLDDIISLTEEDDQPLPDN